MVARLGYKPAHEEKRCLVCHTNPSLASDTLTGGLEEKSSGVGCETCHGPAQKWLEPHTGWSHLDEMQKQANYAEFGMTWLRGPQERAMMCVRCHVGTGQDSDVNHDLIAAGHPRLEFELTAFLANMPPHWIEPSKEAGGEAEAWAVGQVVSARAALQLLQDRATAADKPWPEFAEYDCFACHHNLRDQKWRRDHVRFQHGRTLGSLAWNERYFTLLPVLFDKPPAGWDGARSQLASELARPMPDRARVAQRACALLCLLNEPDLLLRDEIGRGKPFMPLVEELCGAKSPALTNWDAAAQVYLALAALQPKPSKEAAQALQELAGLLAFPHGMNSPGNFREKLEFEKQLKDALSGIRKTFPSRP
jgi:hypothetical protein